MIVHWTLFNPLISLSPSSPIETEHESDFGGPNIHMSSCFPLILWQGKVKEKKAPHAMSNLSDGAGVSMNHDSSRRQGLVISTLQGMAWLSMNHVHTPTKIWIQLQVMSRFWDQIPLDSLFIVLDIKNNKLALEASNISSFPFCLYLPLLIKVLKESCPVFPHY